MTHWEQTDGRDARISISSLFEGDRPISDLNAGQDLGEVIERILHPGFPAMAKLTRHQSAERLRAYIDEVARTDIPRLANVRHDPDVFKQLITSLARSVAADVTYKTLATDLRAIAPAINVETVSSYVRLLERLFIVEPQLSWTPKLRSRARLRTSPKLHLADPALAAAALGAGPEHLHSDLTTLGVLFESAVVHDLTVFASSMGGEVRHYRDSNDKEIDAIIALPDGRWGAVEVKLGGSQVTNGVRSLEKVIDQIDTTTIGAPSFRLIVTGTGPILTVDEETITCPMSALAP